MGLITPSLPLIVDDEMSEQAGAFSDAIDATSEPTGIKTELK